jgi:UDP-perosamine 4-acetyltransferase
VARSARRILVVGAGGHGRVVAEAARLAGHQVVGYIDQDPAASGRAVGDVIVVASQAELLDAVCGGGPPPRGADAVALGIGSNGARHALLERLLAADPELLPPIVHPTAFVSPSARLGAGSVVLPRAIVHTDARVHEGVILNSAAVVEHDCEIGACAHLSPGAITGGRVTIGARAWVGAGATIIHGLTVGADCVVGAGAVVIRDVPVRMTVVGVPARVHASVGRGE